MYGLEGAGCKNVKTNSCQQDDTDHKNDFAFLRYIFEAQ